MENKELVEKLVQKYLDRDCSEKEIALLMEYFGQPQNESMLKHAIRQYFEKENDKNIEDVSPEVSEAINEVHSRLMSSVNTSRSKVRRLRWLRIPAAASLLLLVSLGAYLYFASKKHTQMQDDKMIAVSAQTRQILDYLDTAKLPLDNRKVETIGSRENTIIKSNNKDGQVSISESLKVGSISYNRVTIPRGGQYELSLPDGTKVWLNAASTIAFPEQFNSKERRVKITGEVYFEVAQLTQPDSKERVPFIVSVNKAEVRVLGTHFNVNSYSDENGTVKTTLLEGSVEVVSYEARQKMVIKPGQQAVIQNGELSVKEVNTEEVMAWKNGYFYFNNTRLQNIMQELSRWYDVKIVYEGEIPERKFSGKINKNLSLNEVIELLEYTNVNIRIKDNCILVTQ